MRGDENETWVAHLLELFQVHEDDEVLVDALGANHSIDSSKKTLFMRCTLRWFYGISDMNPDSIASSSLRKTLPEEVYFTDDIERDGFNDVQVIEGIAWLFPSPERLNHFQKSPSHLYNPRYDLLQIVRAFVNNSHPNKPIRKLKKQELDYLLKNPTKDKEMFAKAYTIMTGLKLSTNNPSKKRKALNISPPKSDSDFNSPPGSSSDSGDSSSSSVVKVPLRRLKTQQKSPDTKNPHSPGSSRRRFGRKQIHFTREEREDGSDHEHHENDERISRRKAVEATRKKLKRREEVEARKLRRIAAERQAATLKAERRRKVAHEQRPRNPTTLDDTNKEVIDFVHEMNGAAGLHQPAVAKSPLDGLAPSGRKQRALSAKGRARPLKPGEDHLKKLRTGALRKKNPVTINLDSDDERPKLGARLLDEHTSEDDSEDDDDDVPIAAVTRQDVRSTTIDNAKSMSKVKERTSVDSDQITPRHSAGKKVNASTSNSLTKKDILDHNAVSKGARKDDRSTFDRSKRRFSASHTASKERKLSRVEAEHNELMDIELPPDSSLAEVDDHPTLLLQDEAGDDEVQIPDDMVADVEHLNQLFGELSTGEKDLLMNSTELILDLGIANVDEEMRKSGGQLGNGAEYRIAKEVAEQLYKRANIR